MSTGQSGFGVEMLRTADLCSFRKDLQTPRFDVESRRHADQSSARPGQETPRQRTQWMNARLQALAEENEDLRRLIRLLQQSHGLRAVSAVATLLSWIDDACNFTHGLDDRRSASKEKKIMNQKEGIGNRSKVSLIELPTKEEIQQLRKKLQSISTDYSYNGLPLAPWNVGLNGSCHNSATVHHGPVISTASKPDESDYTYGKMSNPGASPDNGHVSLSTRSKSGSLSKQNERDKQYSIPVEDKMGYYTDVSKHTAVRFTPTGLFRSADGVLTYQDLNAAPQVPANTGTSVMSSDNFAEQHQSMQHAMEAGQRHTDVRVDYYSKKRGGSSQAQRQTEFVTPPIHTEIVPNAHGIEASEHARNHEVYDYNPHSPHVSSAKTVGGEVIRKTSGINIHGNDVSRHPDVPVMRSGLFRNSDGVLAYQVKPAAQRVHSNTDLPPLGSDKNVESTPDAVHPLPVRHTVQEAPGTGQMHTAERVNNCSESLSDYSQPQSNVEFVTPPLHTKIYPKPHTNEFVTLPTRTMTYTSPHTNEDRERVRGRRVPGRDFHTPQVPAGKTVGGEAIKRTGDITKHVTDDSKRPDVRVIAMPNGPTRNADDLLRKEDEPAAQRTPTGTDLQAPVRAEDFVEPHSAAPHPLPIQQNGQGNWDKDRNKQPEVKNKSAPARSKKSAALGPQWLRFMFPTSPPRSKQSVAPGPQWLQLEGEDIRTQAFIATLSRIKKPARLIGEVAFQLDRRILNYIFNNDKRSKDKRRFYSYTISNIPEMMRQEATEPAGTLDEGAYDELRMRYASLMSNHLSALGYDIAYHGPVASDLVNKHGLLPVAHRQDYICHVHADNRDLLEQVLRSVTPPSQFDDVLVLLRSLAWMSSLDGKPMVSW